MKVRTPQAYLNVGDDESLAYCLVLEDVGGYASGDHHAGATLEQARAAVVAAAGVHGRWWNQVDQFDWVPPIDSPLNMGLQGMFESSWPMVVDQHGEQLGAEVIARLESYLPTVSDMFASFGASSRTLTHNDFRLDNMFFDDDELVLIDWQLLGRGDGMGDVVPFLTCNLDPALRRAHESDLIDLYRDTLETMDAGYVHLDDLMNAYKLTLNFWLSAWLHNSVTKGETTQRGEELFERIITRTLDAYVEHDRTSPRRWELVTEVTRLDDLFRHPFDGRTEVRRSSSDARARRRVRADASFPQSSVPPTVWSGDRAIGSAASSLSRTDAARPGRNRCRVTGRASSGSARSAHSSTRRDGGRACRCSLVRRRSPRRALCRVPPPTGRSC